MMKENENVLLLHIGTMKTGTSALQHFLYDNNKVLEQQGWRYPDFTTELPEFINQVRDEKNKNGIFFYGLEVKDGIDKKSLKWDKLWETIINNLKEKNVIISAEEIYEYDLLEVLSEAKQRYSNTKVIIYLRRQDRYIESRWAQRLKGTMGDTFEQYVKSLDAERREVKHTLYYFDQLEKIEKVIGKDNIIVRAYETMQFAGERKDIISDFLSVIGVSIEKGDIIEPTLTNERFGENFAEIKRIINVLNENISGLNLDDSQQYFWPLVSCFIRNDKSVGYFSENERHIFLEEFEEQNAMVAKKYMDRHNGELFLDKKMDYHRGLVHATAFEEDLIKTFAYIIFKQYETLKREIKNMSYQNKILVQNFIMLLKKDKKLVK